MDAHDQFLFAQVEKAIESAQWVWDVEAQGMNESSIRQWAKNQPAWKPGHRFIHNELINVKAQTSNLHLEDATMLGNALKNHILAGAGMPPVWFAETSTARANAPEMTDPTFKHLKIRQRIFAELMQLIFRFSVDMSILSGYITFDKRFNRINEQSSFYLKLPDISAKDQRALSVALRNFSGSMKDCIDLGIFTVDEAKEYMSRYIEMTGLDTMKDAPPLDYEVKPTTVFGSARESGLSELTTSNGVFYINNGQEHSAHLLTNGNLVGYN